MLDASRGDLMTPSTPGSIDSDPGHMSPRFILGGRVSLGQDSVSSVPRGGGGDPLLEGGIDEWEIVEGASSLYVFSGSRLRPARLQGRRMNTDQRAETLRQSARLFVEGKVKRNKKENGTRLSKTKYNIM